MASVLDTLPLEVLSKVLLFLTNDPCAVGRLAICGSTHLRTHLTSHAFNDNWRLLGEHQWPHTGFRLAKNAKSFHEEFQRRKAVDSYAGEVLNDISDSFFEVASCRAAHPLRQPHLGPKTLAQILGKVISNKRISWGPEVHELLLAYAKAGMVTAAAASQRSQGAIASVVLRRLHFSNFLKEWQQIETKLQSMEAVGEADGLQSAEILEEYVIVLSKYQRPTQSALVAPKNSENIIRTAFDTFAKSCRAQMKKKSVSESQITKKMAIMRDILVVEFKGNQDDYYDYNNSLLDSVVESKLGIPLSLCIVYVCVARRLGIEAHVIGLPGHVVLGFRDEQGEMQFCDVYHEGRTLTLAGCQRICASYGIAWRPMFVRPLRPQEVFQRICNNIQRCSVEGERSYEKVHGDELTLQRGAILAHANGRTGGGYKLQGYFLKRDLVVSPSLIEEYGLEAYDIQRQFRSSPSRSH